MEISYTNKEIKFNKELNSLDKLVIDFTSVLNELDIKYVVISGYVSILFGRSRSSEDIDLVIEKMDIEKFKLSWQELYKKFVCITTDDFKVAYNEYLMTKLAIRFSKENVFIPNIEIKFPKIDLESFALKEKVRVMVNGNELYVSPIELQISFKLFLGSEKDIEDARHLFNVFKKKLDMELLSFFNQKLNIGHLFTKYLK